MEQYTNGCSMRLAVPDSHLLSPYPPNDSPPSFYDHSNNTFYLPSSSIETAAGSNKKLSDNNNVMHLFEDSPLDLPDLDSSQQFSPYWTDVLSNTTSPLSSSSPSVDTVTTFLDSSTHIPFPHPMSTSSSNYLDLSLFCEPPGMVTPPSECPSMLQHTLPPTSLSSEPLTPDQQEIEDIMTSLQDGLLPYDNSPSQYVFQDSPSSFVSTATICDDIIPEPVTSPTDNLQSVSMATPTMSDVLPSPVTPPCPPSSPLASPPSLPSPVVTTKTKQAAKKQQTRRKMSTTKKKERKKEQNKTAALRYRQKKREEAMVIEERQEELEKKNKELKSEVYCLENEIKYLKQLWNEVSKARQKQLSKQTHTN